MAIYPAQFVEAQWKPCDFESIGLECPTSEQVRQDVREAHRNAERYKSDKTRRVDLELVWCRRHRVSSKDKCEINLRKCIR